MRKMVQIFEDCNMSDMLSLKDKCALVDKWSGKYSIHVFKPETFNALPPWERVEDWRGKLVAVCDYEASYTAPNPPIWNEGYPAWWHLTNVWLVDEPIPCRGNVGMWRLPDNVSKELLCRF